MIKEDIKGVNWQLVGTLSFRIFVAGVTIGMAYAASTLVSKADLEGKFLPLKEVPIKVDNLLDSTKRIDIRVGHMEDWRRVKDEIDVRLTILMEGQQKMLERQQIQMEHLTRRLNKSDH